MRAEIWEIESIGEMIPVPSESPITDIESTRAALAEYWRKGWREREWMRLVPLAAHGPNDPGNPFWEVIRLMPSVSDMNDRDRRPAVLEFPRFPHWSMHLPRPDWRSLVGTFAHAIPSPGDIGWIVERLYGKGIVEIGAGSGYWAWQLARAGVDVIAYDLHVDPDHRSHFGRFYHHVEPGDARKAAEHPDRALMLVWPTDGNAYAARALDAYSGETLIYVGSDRGGCTADSEFFDRLARDWRRVGTSPSHFTWLGIPSRISFWRRISR
ncbi:hypothetical protein [Nocardia terpenica]|uniref:Uncharacterized protein n=1 Tax=Nocardia terpenica TaxID=455432 RepID=A0A164MGM1_9NOCA|nr:hypothetical protein [Nocardia terpenica]KZM73342.1 hypothetical protein AWN90_32305 [Nocardia terpenica]NQE87504.1 hypothetical protein [Nocardia terpenica]